MWHPKPASCNQHLYQKKRQRITESNYKNSVPHKRYKKIKKIYIRRVHSRSQGHGDTRVTFGVTRVTEGAQVEREKSEKLSLSWFTVKERKKIKWLVCDLSGFAILYSWTTFTTQLALPRRPTWIIIIILIIIIIIIIIIFVYVSH